MMILNLQETIMKTSTKIIITALSLGMAGGVFAFGAHKYSNMSVHDKASMVQQKVVSQLNLTDEQQEKFDTLSNRVVTLVQQAKSQKGDHKAILAGLINEQPLNQAALLSRVNEKTSMVNEHAPEVVALLANFVDSLDIGQKAELKQMMNEKMAWHGQGHGKKNQH